MPRGGARNRSGPQADPTSGRSDSRGYTLQTLPTTHKVRAPKWPLLPRNVYYTIPGPDGGRFCDETATAAIAEREAEMWRWAWRQPQAAAWILPTESFRIPVVAMWVRTFVLCESSEATAADKGSLHRFADQIGMTTAGLAEMGWKIVDGATAPKVTATVESAEKDGTVTPIAGRRMRGVG